MTKRKAATKAHIKLTVSKGGRPDAVPAWAIEARARLQAAAGDGSSLPAWNSSRRKSFDQCNDMKAIIEYAAGGENRVPKFLCELLGKQFYKGVRAAVRDHLNAKEPQLVDRIATCYRNAHEDDDVMRLPALAIFFSDI